MRCCTFIVVLMLMLASKAEAQVRWRDALRPLVAPAVGLHVESGGTGPWYGGELALLYGYRAMGKSVDGVYALRLAAEGSTNGDVNLVGISFGGEFTHVVVLRLRANVLSDLKGQTTVQVLPDIGFALGDGRYAFTLGGALPIAGDPLVAPRLRLGASLTFLSDVRY
jgi:hypothetical protein